MRVLLTNDDGIQAPGLRSLYEALARAGHEVHVVAPAAEQSAVGHALTFLTPIRADRFRQDGFEGYAVTGTPVDCVKLGVSTLMDEPPDIVVSGINKGANVGVDIVYSGTVSAATEGALMNISALSVSMDDFTPRPLDEQAEYAVALMGEVPWESIPPKTLLNLNFPNRPLSEALEMRCCEHTRVPYRDWYVERKDPRGRPYYWLEGEIPPGMINPERDRALLTKGHITLTPLTFEFTDRTTLELLEARFGKK